MSAARGAAVWFTSPRHVELREEAVPEPGAGEVLVEAIVSLISSGTEMLVYRGECASELEFALDRPGRAGSFPFPVKYGYQVVARVIDAGVGATAAVGDVVFARHPHQSRFVLPARPGTEQWFFPVPVELEPRRAALANLYGVGFNALLDHPVECGSVVAVSGAGVVGLAIAELARGTAERVIVVDPSPGRRELAELVGADACVAPADARAAIDELSEGRGADVHFEASGAPAAAQAGLATLAEEGALVVVSNFGNREVALQLSPEFHYRRLSIVSSQAGRVRPALGPRWTRSRRVAAVMHRLRTITPLEKHLDEVALADAGTAYQRIDAGLGDRLGVLLTYGDSHPPTMSRP